MMRCGLGLAVALAWTWLASGQENALPPDVQALVKQGRGTPEGRQAWERVVKTGPSMLPFLLQAMDTKDTATSNWLRTAFDRILDQELQKGAGQIDADDLLTYAKDARKQGRARRLALDVVEKLRPGTSAGLYPSWLEDPEFRYEAVTLALERARSLAKAGAKDQAAAAFRSAFDSSRDVLQGRAAALGLADLGAQASVAQHLGFFVDWYVIGPFDGQGMKGFHLEYPPEKSVDLKAELQGQNGKVKWKRFKVPEAAPASAAKHQVLVVLRESAALGDADDAVAFAYTAFSVKKARQAEFRGAADDNLTVWVNGQKVFAFEEYRNGVRLDRHRFKVNLQDGLNTVLVKICQTPAPNPEPNWEFFLRVVDETGKGIDMLNALP